MSGPGKYSINNADATTVGCDDDNDGADVVEGPPSSERWEDDKESGAVVAGAVQR